MVIQSYKYLTIQGAHSLTEDVISVSDPVTTIHGGTRISLERAVLGPYNNVHKERDTVALYYKGSNSIGPVYGVPTGVHCTEQVAFLLPELNSAFRAAQANFNLSYNVTSMRFTISNAVVPSIEFVVSDELAYLLGMSGIHWGLGMVRLKLVGGTLTSNYNAVIERYKVIHVSPYVESNVSTVNELAVSTPLVTTGDKFFPEDQDAFSLVSGTTISRVYLRASEQYRAYVPPKDFFLYTRNDVSVEIRFYVIGVSGNAFLVDVPSYILVFRLTNVDGSSYVSE